MAGNKCDIEESQKQVTLKQAEEVSKENNITYFETSAKTNEGVNELFMEMIKQIIITKRKQKN
jgi:Ras-related protein Rab-8A